ncbi:MAG: hypothetical protein WCH39_28390, partial [Schlesneria sp.]
PKTANKAPERIKKRKKFSHGLTQNNTENSKQASEDKGLSQPFFLGVIPLYPCVSVFIRG